MRDCHSGLQTTITSLRIIDLAAETDALRLTTVVDQLNIAKSTAHHHLSTLVDTGFLVKQGPVYHLSLKFFSFGERARDRLGPRERFQAVIGALAEETREEAVLVFQDDGRLVTIYSVPHDRVMDTERKIGRYNYLHNSATGKAILARLSPERVESIVDRWGLPATTEQTITSLDALHEDLRLTRERGYARSDQEFIPGMIGLGQIIWSPERKPVAAIGISGPMYRLNQQGHTEPLVKVINRAATQTEDILRT